MTLNIGNIYLGVSIIYNVQNISPRGTWVYFVLYEATYSSVENENFSLQYIWCKELEGLKEFGKFWIFFMILIFEGLYACSMRYE